MTEKPAESARDAAETGALPTPNISPDSSGQPTSTAPDTAQLLKELVPALREALLPDLSETVRRQAQSSVDGATREFGKFAKHLKKYTPEELDSLARDIALDEWMDERRKQSAPSFPGADRGGSSAAELQAWAEKELAEAELPANDPDIVAHFQRPQTAEQFRSGLQKLVVKKLKQGRPVSAASNVGEGGGKTPAVGDEELGQLYARLAETQKSPSMHAAERAEIKERIAKLEAAQR